MKKGVFLKFNLCSKILVIEENLVMSITQDQLSTIVEKLLVKTVGDIERAKVSRGVNSLYRIAAAFNIEIHELVNINFSFQAYYYKMRKIRMKFSKN